MQFCYIPGLNHIQWVVILILILILNHIQWVVQFTIVFQIRHQMRLIRFGLSGTNYGEDTSAPIQNTYTRLYAHKKIIERIRHLVINYHQTSLTNLKTHSSRFFPSFSLLSQVQKLQSFIFIIKMRQILLQSSILDLN